MKSKNKINVIISICLGILFLILWLHIIDWQEFKYYLLNFNVKTALLFSGFYLLAYFLRSFRWKLILDPVHRISIMESYGIFMTGLLINFLIPIRAGEIAKSVILKNKHKTPISQSLPTIFIDKFADLFPILIILVLIPLISVNLNSYLYTIIILLVLIFFVFLGFIYFAMNHKSKAVAILNVFIKFLPKSTQRVIQEFLSRFVEGFTIMKGRRTTIYAITVVTSLAVLSESLYIFMLFSSFGITVSYLKILFGYTLMNLTYILPTPPAQIGSNQFMWVVIFSIGLGLNENLTSAAVTFSHLLTSILIFLISIISVISLKIKFTDIIRY
ncbi:lysylphosphatidylglycerol synthase transmembrane domain-containing protein [Candidatus Cloacimonadota bacterium]